MASDGGSHSRTRPQQGSTEAAAAEQQQSETAFTRAVQLQQAEGRVLDAAFNTPGDRVATISDAGVLQVWDCPVSAPDWQLLHAEQLPAAPLQLAWAHPRFGAVLAVGTEDGSVHILQQQSQQHAGDDSSSWSLTAQLPCGHVPISALAFSPQQHGLVLAAACQERALLDAVLPADALARAQVVLFEGSGKVTGAPLQWTRTSKVELPQGAGACTCLSWHSAGAGLPPLLAGGHGAGGCIWAYRAATMTWQEVASFAAPTGAASDGDAGGVVALHWAPAMGRPHELLAASYGRCVVLYRVSPAPRGKDEAAQQQQQAAGGGQAAAAHQQQQQQLGRLRASALQELQHAAPVWRLEFNALGNALACSLDGAPAVWLWMPVLEGSWQLVTRLAGAPTGGASQQQLMPVD